MYCYCKSKGNNFSNVNLVTDIVTALKNRSAGLNEQRWQGWRPAVVPPQQQVAVIHHKNLQRRREPGGKDGRRER